jgi:hypothetical protein
VRVHGLNSVDLSSNPIGKGRLESNPLILYCMLSAFKVLYSTYIVPIVRMNAKPAQPQDPSEIVDGIMIREACRYDVCMGYRRTERPRAL